MAFLRDCEYPPYNGTIDFDILKQTAANFNSNSTIWQLKAATYNLMVLLESDHDADLRYVHALEIAKSNTDTSGEPEHVQKYMKYLSDTYEMPADGLVRNSSALS